MGREKTDSSLDNQGGVPTENSSSTVVLNGEELEKFQKNPAFSSRLLISPNVNKPYFFFHYHGQSLEGFLGIDHNNIAISRTKSYMIETPGGWEEFFANQHLQRIFERHKLEGRYIRITYMGDERTGWGHARKIYRVELLPVKQRDSAVWKTGPVK